MLAVEGVSKTFGGVQALSDVTIEIAADEIAGLIGPNGAGKTTLFNVVSGFFRPTSGRVRFDGKDITGMAPHALAARGLVRTFQGARVFPGLTVREGLRIAGHLRGRRGAPRAQGFDLLAEADLERYADELAGSLPSGVTRILGIAMAIGAGARMLLLDEPAAGLNAEEIARLADIIRRVHAAGVTVLVIEHNLHFLMGLVGRAIVLDSGALIADGPPAEVTRDPGVIDAYLGAQALARG